MGDWLMNILGDIPINIRILIAASFPVTELRAAIPLAIALGISPAKAFFLGVIGNLLPIIPLLVIMPYVYEILGRISSFQRILGRIIERTRRKGAQVEKYGALGLLFFVALPLPGTGAWTGSMLAFIMGINFWYSVMALSIGVVLAGGAVTFATMGLLQIVKYLYNLEILAVVLILSIVSWWIIKRWMRTKNY